MECERYLMLIQEYIDEELPKGSEGDLFTHLSICADCREDFKQQNIIKHAVKISQKEISPALEKRVFENIKTTQKSFAHKYLTRQSPVYINYILGAMLLVLILLSLFQISSLRGDLNDFKQQYETASLQLQNQSRQFNAVLNSIPAIKIEPVNKKYNF